MMVISYNTLAITGCIFSLLLLLSTNETFLGWTKRILAGVFLSMAVLCIPYLTFFFIFYSLASLLVSFSRLKLNHNYSFYRLNNLIGLTIGCTVCFFSFLSLLLSQSELNDVIYSIPYIILGDDTHELKSFYYLTFAYFVRILWGNDRNIFTLIIYIIIAGCCLYSFFDKRRVHNQKLYLCLAGILGIVLQFVYMITDNYINYHIFVPNVVSFIIICFFYEQILQKCGYFICSLYVPGIVITYLEYVSSNTGFYCISYFSCISTIASLIIIFETISFKRFSFIYQSSLFFFIVFSFFSLFYSRLTYVYWEDLAITQLNTIVSSGPVKGLHVSAADNKRYENMMLDTKEIREMPDNAYVLYFGDLVFYSLGKQKLASYSPIQYSRDRSLLYSYYNRFVYKKPQVVYIELDYPESKKIALELSKKLSLTLYQKNFGFLLK